MQEKEFDMIRQIIRIVILKNNKSVTDILKKGKQLRICYFRREVSEGFSASLLDMRL